MIWYTLYTKPLKEMQVESLLQARGVATYLPLIRVRPTNPRARKVRAFFPRYLFAQVDPARTGPGDLNWTPGLVRVVGFGSEPAAMPDAAIRRIQARLAELEAAGWLDPNGFRPGDRVRVVEGPFADLDAVFDRRLSPTGRCRVLLSFLGQQVGCEVEAGQIQPVKRHT
ncbi:MAG: hypothetical protein KKA73_13895 [Chloroflexi bacterium]|nr:hypothetical protein [Chloroflexota bacterium]MBU1748776.1 hypothetical protein [Chloroflexota bacterium]